MLFVLFATHVARPPSTVQAIGRHDACAGGRAGRGFGQARRLCGHVSLHRVGHGEPHEHQPFDEEGEHPESLKRETAQHVEELAAQISAAETQVATITSAAEERLTHFEKAQSDDNAAIVVLQQPIDALSYWHEHQAPHVRFDAPCRGARARSSVPWTVLNPRDCWAVIRIEYSSVLTVRMRFCVF